MSNRAQVGRILMQGRLERIRDRYFRSVIGHPSGIVTHHGDCNIHRAIDPEVGQDHATCTCGLLHDLQGLGNYMTEKIYPLFSQDDVRQEIGLKFYDEAWRAECRAREEPDWEALGFSREVIPHDDAKDWKEIEEVFGAEAAVLFKSQFERVSVQDFWEAHL